MLDPVSIRYADALFNLARKGGVLDRVGEDVRRLAADLAKPEVAAFFFDARVSAGARRAKLEPLLAGMHELVRNFVSLVFDRRREEVLKGLGEAFHRRTLREGGAAEGVVESARPMGREHLQGLETALGGRLGKRVSLENRVVPDLIGGVRVIVDSSMIDLSFQGRLEGLRRTLFNAPLPTIREA